MLENIPAISFIIFIVMLGVIFIDITSKSKEAFVLKKRRCDYVNRPEYNGNQNMNIYNDNHLAYYWPDKKNIIYK